MSDPITSPLPKRDNVLLTEFAPAEREPIEIVRRQAAQVKGLPWVPAIANSMLNIVLILNARRQIVFASENIKQLMPDVSPVDLLGQRPGEALGCTHAQLMPGGCGASSFCSECGALRAVLASLVGRRDVEECRLLLRTGRPGMDALDFLVVATPLKLGGEDYCIVALSDISHEKRRRALERIFFHDLINIAGGVEGLAGIIAASAPDAMQRDLRLLQDGLRDMLEEIQAQKDLAAAETHELVVHPAPIHAGELLRQLTERYQHNPIARRKQIVLAAGSVEVEFTADPVVLRRVLGNVVKNALEASQPGQTVTIRCAATEDDVRFQVHNTAVMARSVQLQVFKRSFSTKGAGRGLGTYSVKLLTERYLRGQVSFTTLPEQGTTFTVILPRNFPPGH